MPRSQNARFSGKAPHNPELDDPPGGSIARLLRDSLANRGWTASDPKDWRGSGWSIPCARNGSRLLVVLLKLTSGDEWFLQISPTSFPGIVGWLLGRSASATPNDIQLLADDAFAILTVCGQCQDFRWCWDGWPVSDPSSLA